MERFSCKSSSSSQFKIILRHDLNVLASEESKNFDICLEDIECIRELDKCKLVCWFGFKLKAGF